MTEVLQSYDLAGPDPRPMSVVEVTELKKLCRGLPSTPTIIQIGAERGVSTLAILEERPDAFLFSIDVGERPEEIANVKAAHLDARRVVRGLGRSQSIGMFWPTDWLADMIFVDGDHRYAGVQGDIAAWMPCVKPGGLFVFHDYIAPEDRTPSIIGRVWEAIRDINLVDHYKYTLVDRLIAFEC